MAMMGAHLLQPNSVGSSGYGNWHTFDGSSDEVKRIISGLKRFVTAKMMKDHMDTVGLLDNDIVWDAPPIYLRGKEKMRVIVYLAKFAADLDFAPKLVREKTTDKGKSYFEMHTTFSVYPKRTLLIPASLLLPKEIPIESTIEIGYKGFGGPETRVTSIKGRIHNFLSLPWPIRAYFGYAFGIFGTLTEPLWSELVQFVGDDTYKKVHSHDLPSYHPGPDHLGFKVQTVVGKGVDTLKATTTTAIHTAGNVANTAKNTAWSAVNTASNLTGSALNTAKDTAAKVTNTAVDTAKGAAATARDTAYGVAGMAMDTANTAMNVAKDTASAATNAATTTAGAAIGTAGAAADTTASAAGATLGAAKNTAYGAANLGKDAAANVASTITGTAATVTGAVHETTVQADRSVKSRA